MEHAAPAASAMPALLGDVYAIYGAAFILFAVLAFVFLKKPLTGWMDAQIAAIQTDLEQARALRAEAEKMLADYQLKQQAAEREAATILAKARAEADLLKKSADAALKAQIARMELQVQERIARAEAEALAEIRARAVDEAQAMVQILLQQKLTPTADEAALENVLADLPALLAAHKNAA